MNWRTAHRNARKPRHVCKSAGHVEHIGYGFAFGGGLGGYGCCERCGVLLWKVLDDGDADRLAERSHTRKAA